MEFQPQEEEEAEEVEEMALPISSTYGDIQMIHHHHHDNDIIPLSSLHHHHQQPPPPPPMEVVVRYKECLKNHAAAMGGKATDGCGEFMASGEEGTLEAFTCSVCNCHRNFHRKEIIDNSYDHPKRFELGNGRNAMIHPKGFLGTQESFVYNHNNNSNNNNNAGVPSSIKGPPQLPMIMSYNMSMGSFPSESPLPQVMKKRFRTKFSNEQKEKMLSFAEKVGWKMQKQQESMIQDFCQQVGIKRRVLKVWMHNNKQNLAKNNTCSNSISINPPQDPN